MANTRTISAATSTATSVVTSPVTGPAAGPPGRHRLRAVSPDEVISAPDFLPPGATWMPAPPHALPALPGQPPMIGYLVLVPVEQRDQVPAAGAGDGPVTIDGTRRTALVEGQPLDLTYLEFELLAHLVANPHRVHTRDQLVTTVWGYGHVGDGRTVDVHVARLRRKLGAEHRHTIQTVRRVGYKYAP
ncbi:winged helix-turn-helix domain-containing protein [Streptomyces sp. HMX112]|uniref:winged helix-turn-helix domain-containing protein n=1 Tax=Streptomyces sp. HMX112 TaxID=3390850 RepID=UPI003A810BD3